jgi:hypothetical protein
MTAKKAIRRSAQTKKIDPVAGFGEIGIKAVAAAATQCAALRKSTSCQTSQQVEE